MKVTTVLRAFHDLRARDKAPSADDIARYLKADADEVLEHLRGLKQSRILDDRRRKGRRVWFLWSEVNR